MYAVVQLGSQQFKVAQGDTIEVRRIKEEVGKDLALDQVLLFATGQDIRIGQPYLTDVKVKAVVVAHTKDEKKIAYKYRKRKASAKKIGHRAQLTALNITKIET